MTEARDDHARRRPRDRPGGISFAVAKAAALASVVAEASDGAAAYRLYKETRPDLVIMDLTMPGFGGVEAIKRDPAMGSGGARILVFTMHQNAAYAVQAIRAGAKGYVTKSSPPEELLRAIFDVLREGPRSSADIDHELALSRVAGESAAVEILTPREFEILRMLLAERTTEKIAEILHVSPKTVANTLISSRASLAWIRISSLSVLRFGNGSWTSGARRGAVRCPGAALIRRSAPRISPWPHQQTIDPASFAC